MITGPIIAEIAALIEDAARATMVAALLDGLEGCALRPLARLRERARRRHPAMLLVTAQRWLPESAPGPEAQVATAGRIPAASLPSRG